MSKLLFKMRYVPDDEAQEVRELLDSNEIEFFETFAGNWGISVPALWLQNDDQYDFAQQVLNDYQAERTARVKEEYELSRQRGETRTMWHSFLDNPIRFIVYVGLAGLVLFLSLRLFLSI